MSEIPSLWFNVQIRAFGSTTTQDFESDPFATPSPCVRGAWSPTSSPVLTAPRRNRGHPCNVAQDAPVDCCLSGNDLLCPPPVVP